MEPPYDRAVHRVDIVPNTLLHQIIGQERLGVNSYHHQAVRDLAQSLEVMAVSEDGLVEAAAMPGKRFVLGVQWHPEFSYEVEESSRAIAQAFVGACR